MNQKITIGIPTHNRHGSLKRLLESISEQNVLPFEVLVVTNSHDSEVTELTENYLNSFSCKHIQTGTVGISPARQKILEETDPTTDILYFVDDDCFFDDTNHLEKLLHAHSNEPRALAVGGGYCSPGLSFWDKVYNASVYFWIQKSLVSDKNKMLPGGNMSLKFKQLDSKIRFSEQHLFSGEDTDFNNKLQRSNGTLAYFEGLDVPHKPELTFNSLVAKARQQGRTKSTIEPDAESENNFTLLNLLRVRFWPPEYLFALFVYLPLVYLSSYLSGRRAYVEARPNS